MTHLSTVASIIVVFTLFNLTNRTFSFPTEIDNETEDVDAAVESTRGIPWKTLNGKPPILVAHRGERVLLPANTLPAYEIAAIEGADYLEPDLYLTKDDVFVCFHDLFLKAETDVESHPEFEHLRRNFTSAESNENGVESAKDDWVIKDFTYAELKTLRVKQMNVGIRPQYFNFEFGIPTYQELIEVAHRMTVKLDRTFGIAPELKFPPFQNSDKSPFYVENKFLEVMRANGYGTIESPEENCVAHLNESYTTNIACLPVIIQSFNHDTLKYLRTQIRYEQLLLLGIKPQDYTYAGLMAISRYANYAAIWKELFLDPDVANSLLVPNLAEPARTVSVAHRMGLKVAVFTLRDSREYPQGPSSNINCTGPTGVSLCPVPIRNKRTEMNHFFKLGVDGLFIENVAESVLIRAEYGKLGKQS